ncbi:MAG: RNA polymerase sigma factor [Actinomycetia bacterium]|nr:RNA polymerase sigma factor [Actinomycetes bacterium]
MSNRRLRRSSSATVIDRAKDGDEQAFGLLFRENHAILVRYAGGLGTRNPEDVVSQVWFEVARSIGSFEGDESNFRGWIFTICRRRVIDAHRTRSRRPETPVAEPAAPHPSPPADEELDAADRAVELMASLPRAQAEVIMLRVIAGLSVEEVAELTDRRPGTVRVLAHRGLRQLAKLLQAPAELWAVAEITDDGADIIPLPTTAPQSS